MFSLINNFITLMLVLLLGVPLLAFVAYIAAYFAQGLFGGPIWLWMVITIVIAIGGAIEEYNKRRDRELS